MAVRWFVAVTTLVRTKVLHYFLAGGTLQRACESSHALQCVMALNGHALVRGRDTAGAS